MKIIDTFSGIGGFSYAAEKLVGGFQTISFIECDPYCQKILKKHWPNVPIHDDIRTYQPEPYSADVVCGGFPCQDISIAGKQLGVTKETRSGLFYELMRVIRLVRPDFVILENVAAILTNGLGIVLGELASAGFDCEYACIPARALGACHKRDRWWLVAYPSSVNRRQKIEVQARRNTTIRSSVADPNKARLQEKRPEQQTTRIEQYRELGNVTNSNSKGMERRIEPINQEMQKTRLAWQSNTPHLSPNWRSYVSEPVLRRGDDGLSNRVHRLKALGNSVVPQVAAIPLQRVKELHTTFKGK